MNVTVDLPKLFGLLLGTLAECTPEESVEDIEKYRESLIALLDQTKSWIENLDEMLADIAEAGGYEEWSEQPIEIRILP